MAPSSHFCSSLYINLPNLRDNELASSLPKAFIKKNRSSIPTSYFFSLDPVLVPAPALSIWFPNDELFKQLRTAYLTA